MEDPHVMVQSTRREFKDSLRSFFDEIMNSCDDPRLKEIIEAEFLKVYERQGIAVDKMAGCVSGLIVRQCRCNGAS